MSVNYFLYILQSEVKETFYIGSSADPERRLGYHNRENKGHTRRFRPWKLVFTIGFETQEDAERAEKKVKNWKSKKMICLLINGKIDIREYLK